MAEKAFCPGCESHTSDLYRAVMGGEPCPYCGLPAEVIEAVEKARDRHADEAILKRLMEAEQRAASAEREAGVLASKLSRIRSVIDEKYE